MMECRRHWRTWSSSQLNSHSPAHHIFAVKPSALTAELRELRSELIDEQGALNQRHTFFFAQVLEARNEKLTEKHKTVREAGRKQQAVCAELEIVFGKAESEMNRCIQHRGQCTANAKGTRADRKSLNRFASDAEIKASDRRVALAAAALTESQGEETKALDALNVAIANLNAAKKELRKLSEAESQLRNALAGKEMIDPETGLTGVPDIA